MALSSCSARQGLLHAVARSARGVVATAGRRSLTSVPAPPQLQQLLRRDALPAASCRAWSVLSQSQQQAQQRRSFAASGSGKDEDDSDDDFKPKRKVVSDDADAVSDLIKKQVCGTYTCIVVYLLPTHRQL